MPALEGGLRESGLSQGFFQSQVPGLPSGSRTCRRTSETYYVSRGMRHRVRRVSWILSRPKGMGCVEDIALNELEALPEGLPLE